MLMKVIHEKKAAWHAAKSYIECYLLIKYFLLFMNSRRRVIVSNLIFFARWSVKTDRGAINKNLCSSSGS